MLFLRKTHLNFTKALPAAAFVLAVFPAGLYAQAANQTQIEDNLAAASGGVPAILLQYASVVSAANTITISRAPVTTSTGDLIYEDITLQFAVGRLDRSPSHRQSPRLGRSPILLVAGFEAGTYVDADFGGVALAGTGHWCRVSVWSVALAATYWDCTTPDNATSGSAPLPTAPLQSD